MKKTHKIGLAILMLAAVSLSIVVANKNRQKKPKIENPPVQEGGNKEEVIHSDAKVLTEGGVQVYLTSTEQAQSGNWYKKPTKMAHTLTKVDSLNITEVDETNVTKIQIDTSKTYDPFYGIGTSLEESTVYNLLQLKEDERKEFIYKLVDPVEGAGMTLFRLTIGTSDFTGQTFYTYYDEKTVEGEPNWYPAEGEEGFSIQKDIDNGIVEIAKLVIEAAKFYGVEDEIRFFSSPWTPPGWMKLETPASKTFDDNELLIRGGRLNSDYIDDLATYYTRYVEEYTKLGIPISALTLQNEPLLEINYPSCHMTPVQSAKLTIALKKALSESEILKEHNAALPRLWTFDHNPADLLSFMGEFFSVEDALEALDGVAVHDYSGALSEMEFLKELYFGGTDKTVHLTERSVWGTEGANRIVEYYRNGAVSYNSWVTMLDSNISPHQWVGTPSVTMFVREAGSDTNYWACPEFYIAGNFGRFIRPGMVRVESDFGSYDTVTNVVYANREDGTMVAVVVNQTGSNQTFKFEVNGKQIMGTLPGKNVATYVWKEEPSAIKEPAINQKGEEEVEEDTSLRQVDAGKAIVVGDSSVALKEDDAFEKNGSLMSQVEKGSYVDYLLDVKEAGTYQITYSVKCDSDGSGIAQGLSVHWGKKDNMAQVGDNKKNISIPSLYGAQKIRYAIELEEGMQTLRLKVERAGYSVSNVVIEKAGFTPIAAGETKISTISFYDAQGGHAIENDSNIGYTSYGSSFDYKVEVNEGGTYNFKLNYASANAQPSVGLYTVNEDGTTNLLGKITLNSTGDWGSYTLSEEITAELTAGEHTLRLVVEGDGMNAREIIVFK